MQFKNLSLPWGMESSRFFLGDLNQGSPERGRFGSWTPRVFENFFPGPRARFFLGAFSRSFGFQGGWFGMAHRAWVDTGMWCQRRLKGDLIIFRENLESWKFCKNLKTRNFSLPDGIELGFWVRIGPP